MDRGTVNIPVNLSLKKPWLNLCQGKIHRRSLLQATFLHKLEPRETKFNIKKLTKLTTENISYPIHTYAPATFEDGIKSSHAKSDHSMCFMHVEGGEEAPWDYQIHLYASLITIGSHPDQG